MNSQVKAVIFIGLSVLTVGAFVSTAIAPSVTAFESAHDIDQIRQYISGEDWVRDLQRLLNDFGYELVDELDTVRVKLGEEFFVQIKEIIHYQEKQISVDTMYITEEKVMQEGKQGYNLYEIEVVIDNNFITISDKSLIENVETIDEIIGYGAINTVKIDGKDRKILDVMTVEATAYTKEYACTGKNPGDPYYGITASGVPVEKGHIAVDPSVIPYTSEVYIVGLDEIGNEYKGKYIATDTGGAIKGNRIDVYIDNYPEVNRFGRRNMKLLLLDD